MSNFLAAYTESSRDHPPYVSMEAEDGKVTITVRGAQSGDGSAACMSLPAEAAEKLLSDALAALKGEGS